MRKFFSVAISLIAVAALGLAQEHKMPTHIALTAAEVKWVEAPPSLTKGAQFALVSGNPAAAFRRRIDIHRRLMLLSCSAFLPAAIARLPLGFIQTGHILLFFGLTDLCMLVFIVFDTVKHRRLHPAFGWGLLFIVASQPLRLMLAGTQAWMKFAAWLVG